MRDVYVVAAARTAIGKSRRALANLHPVDYAAPVLKAVVERAGIEASQVEDVTMGCAFPEAEQGMNPARMILLRAGYPDTVPAVTVNRFCSSGLESIVLTAAKIRCGLLDIAVAGGVETMSMISMVGTKFAPSPWMTEHCPEIFTSMGCCGDNVARDFGITREQMDEFALSSVQKAVAAIDAGKFKEQIVPIDVPQPDGSTKVFDTDEGPRRDTTLEGLAKLKPAFAPSPKLGSCTAGNSSQTSDGAAAVVLMSEEAVKATGAKPMAKVGGYHAAAASPKYLGPAQVVAVPKALKLTGIKLEDVGLIENNEAFASQCLYSSRELGLNMDIVNVNGGAIALGHPLGCTGAKLSTQIIYEMRARGVKYGLVTMCIGGGLGAAGVFELCE
ncbi:MAG TPA: thiolase family protein [Candidatus Hydrogenedentes bacterium]|nr:thiolase family protein [Candidatus Hydrogenedentota bacterium]HPG69161.1 thiolase family protein [Candidatus Hydrogenedentota bacterium]